MPLFNTVSIANKLEVLPGNVILSPGCEPTSAITSLTLMANQKCKQSTIPLADALAAIPDATLAFMSNPRKLFFVLPEGPPTIPGCNTCDAGLDYYQILRDIEPTQPPPQGVKPCDNFGFGCL